MATIPLASPKLEVRQGLLIEPEAAPFDRERLAQYLRGVGFSVDPHQRVAKFAGGLANRNYLIVVDDRPVVLRRPPDGPLPPGSHDMAREHRILAKLSRVLPFVPDSLHFCANPAVIGAPFQLLEYRSGVVVRGSDLSPVAHISDAPARLSEMLVRTLAEIHAVDAEAAGLGDLGKPEGFVQRAIEGWAKRGALIAGGRAVATLIAEVADWLGGQPFSDRAPTLLHCDFKLDNMILDPETLEPRAVVDWDMGTRGDPLFDLATLLSYWAEPGDPEAMIELDQAPTAKPGFWTRCEAAERYAAITGRDLADLHAMHVLAMLKLGIIFLQLHGQWVSGAVTDGRYAGFRRRGEGLLAVAQAMAREPESPHA